MFELVMQVLSAGLNIWQDKEKTKYIDKLAKIKEQYYVEINKPFDQRDNAALDNLQFELRLAAESFAASVGKSGA